MGCRWSGGMPIIATPALCASRWKPMVHSVAPCWSRAGSTKALEETMYRHDGQDLFVIDAHMHLWDASPENWRNQYGESWIKCFHAYHSALSPAEEVWPFDKFCHYGDEALVDDLFR